MSELDTVESVEDYNERTDNLKQLEQKQSAAQVQAHTEYDQRQKESTVSFSQTHGHQQQGFSIENSGLLQLEKFIEDDIESGMKEVRNAEVQSIQQKLKN